MYQTKKGDILEEGKCIDIKGEVGASGGGIRLFGNIKGNKYCENCISIFENSPFNGNSTTTAKLKHRKVWEIEKKKNESHYIKEFEKNIPLAKKKLKEYLKINFKFEDGEFNIDSMFNQGKWSWDSLYQILIKKFYIITKYKSGCDYIYIFGDGTNLKIIKNEEDLNKLEYESDYFRIGQDSMVGYYIS